MDADETAFAASVALQAYFEDRKFSEEDMNKCLEYWRNNLSERGDPVGRKRAVCCEPVECPMPNGSRLYQCTHIVRNVPYPPDDPRSTKELQAVSDEGFVAARNAYEITHIHHSPRFMKSTTNSVIIKSKNTRNSQDRIDFQHFVGPLDVEESLAGEASVSVPRACPNHSTFAQESVAIHLHHSYIAIWMMTMMLPLFCERFSVNLLQMSCILDGCLMKRRMKLCSSRILRVVAWISS